MDTDRFNISRNIRTLACRIQKEGKSDNTSDYKILVGSCHLKNARAMAMGHVVLLGPKIEKGDLEHELVHVRQFDRFPLIFPFLYYIELLRKGYRNNMYELEAYQLAGNTFKG